MNSGSLIFGIDANDLLGMMHTWQVANIADNEIYNGDFEAACKAIKQDNLNAMQD